MDAAVKTFDEYGRQPSQKANSFDSLGESYFMRGKFDDAEKAFVNAHQSNPALFAGADLMKAAYSHWLAHPGDANELKAADALMARYLEFRRNQKDPLVAWQEAKWLYATGRRDSAIAKLAGAVDTIANKDLVPRQIGVWRGEIELMHDIDTLKQRYETTPPANDSQVRVLYAAALISAGKQAEARPLLELWPMPWAPGDPLLESWVMPKFLELRSKVGLK
jgi:Flp pilus assembly protein TadD